MDADERTSPRVQLIEDATVQVRERYRPQMSACYEQFDRVLSQIQPWSGRGIRDAAERLIAGLFTRTTNTNWAALRALETGFGDQAVMLQRSMFEDMVDLHWIAANPEIAVDRIEQHDRHSSMVLADSVKKYPEFFDREILEGVDFNGRDELDQLFSKYGTRSWTGLSLHRRVTQIEDQWPTESGRELLHFFHDIPHRLNNQTLHVTADSIAAMFRGDSPDGLGTHLRLGPSEANIETALLGVFWTYSQSATLAFKQFEFKDLEQLSMRSAELMNVFATSDGETFRRVARNAPCPCGSGRKYKHCHRDLTLNYNLKADW